MDEQTKKDFLSIMKLSVRKEITDKDILKRIVKVSETTNNFSSELGKLFINRIKKILSGSKEDFKCIICKKNSTINGIICRGCIEAYNKRVNTNNSKINNVEVNSKSDNKININRNIRDNRNIEKNINYNRQKNVKRKYRTSLFGTFMYNITSIINKKVLKKKQKSDLNYQKPISGHVFIGIFTILFFFIYIFSLYAGMVALIFGIIISIYTIIKKISRFKMESLGEILLSMIFFPLGLILLVFGVFKKIGYLYNNRKYIGAGFSIYGMVAYVCATMHDIPGHFCASGIVGYYNMIVLGDFGTRWDRTTSGAIIEMTIFLIGAVICTYMVIGSMSVYLDEVEEYCYNNGLSVRQAFMKMLQSPIETLLMFAPLVLFVLCKTETLEGGWDLDVDNNTHEVSAYRRFRNGKWEEVSAGRRRNPDDIVNNNLSYKGDNPYNGSNPIRNERRK